MCLKTTLTEYSNPQHSDTMRNKYSCTCCCCPHNVGYRVCGTVVQGSWCCLQGYGGSCSPALVVCIIQVMWCYHPGCDGLTQPGFDGLSSIVWQSGIQGVCSCSVQVLWWCCHSGCCGHVVQDVWTWRPDWGGVASGKARRLYSYLLWCHSKLYNLLPQPGTTESGRSRLRKRGTDRRYRAGPGWSGMGRSSECRGMDGSEMAHCTPWKSFFIVILWRWEAVALDELGNMVVIILWCRCGLFGRGMRLPEVCCWADLPL